MQTPTDWQHVAPLIAFMVVMIFMFWLTIIKPAKNRQKAHSSLVETIKEGEEIVTAGGIYGKVIKLREDSVDIEVAPNVRLKLDRRALRRRASDKEDA